MEFLRMQNDEYCLIVDRKSTISYFLLSPAFSKENIYEIYYTIIDSSNFFNRIKRKFIGKYFLYKRKDKVPKFENKIVVLTNEALSAMPDELLYSIRACAKKMVLFFIDEMFNDYKSIYRAKELFQQKKFFDLVYTFSQKDSKQYNMCFTNSYYPRYSVIPKTKKSDIFFIGNLKNRKKLLLDISDFFDEHFVKYNFIVAENRKDFFSPKIHFCSLDYIKSLSHLVSSNCVLDLVDPRQSGMTLRYYEAIVYGKKLLTNNQNVKNMPYYDSRYMKIFSSIDDLKTIPIEWFKSNEYINYGYKDEFEPKRFIVQISQDLSNV